MTDAISIAGRRIGPGRPVWLVAEMSANHGGDFDKAVEILHAAKAAGADAVKTQTYTPDTMTLDCDDERFGIGPGTIWEGRKLYDLYAQAATPWEWHPKLKEVAESLGLTLFSTAFDETSVDFLEQMDVPVHKISSFELVDLPLIAKAASTGKPLLLSTGMATLDEIDEAVSTARDAGARELALLKCTSAYPAPPEEMNLRTISDLAERFGAPVGLSDHSLGVAAAIAAVALGACIVEKHFTLSRDADGPDSAFSTTPDEFKAMATAAGEAQQALGEVSFEPTASQQATLVFRRSLFIVRDVVAGEPVTKENVRSIRPADGMAPKHLPNVLGKAFASDFPTGTPLSWDCLIR
jgi:N-acetylneuraminate synthase